MRVGRSKWVFLITRRALTSLLEIMNESLNLLGLRLRVEIAVLITAGAQRQRVWLIDRVTARVLHHANAT